MSKPLALVIEDEYDISIIFARALREAGYEADFIRSGDTALTWLAAEVPDLVILDLNLPRVPGPRILEHIRGDARFEKTRVIVATANIALQEQLINKDIPFLAECVSQGFTAVLAKGRGNYLC